MDEERKELAREALQEILEDNDYSGFTNAAELKEELKEDFGRCIARKYSYDEKLEASGLEETYDLDVASAMGIGVTESVEIRWWRLPDEMIDPETMGIDLDAVVKDILKKNGC